MQTARKFQIKPPTATVLVATAVFVISALVYGQFGYQGYLTRDDALFTYSGQQLAKGVPPYVSVFDHKGPMVPFLTGASALLSKYFDLDDVITVRFFFFIISCFTVVGVYLLGSTLFASRWVGLLSASTFLGFGGFGRHALSGPRAKTPMVLFEVFSLFLTARKRWFLAGICGSLAFLSWQPTAVYPLVTIMLAITQAESGRERVKNFIGAVLGVLIPIVAVSVYFLFKGVFYELIEGAILFNVFYLERPQLSFLHKVLRPIQAVYHGYATMIVPIFLGLLMVCLAYPWRMSLQKGRIGRVLSQDPFAAFLLTFPAPVLWSVIDFQRYPDFYIFLPYAAIGFGWLLNITLERMMGYELTGSASQRVAYLVLCIFLVGSAGYYYHMTAEKGLEKQRKWAKEVESTYGRHAKIISIGAPEILVLLKKTNPNRYVFITAGIDNMIDAKTPGGFEGWLREMDNYEHPVIVLGKYRGKYKEKLDAWLEAKYQKQTIGPWSTFALCNKKRKKRKKTSSGR